MPKDINETLEEIKEEAELLCGWDDLKVIGINKYGTEVVVQTDHGNVKMSIRDLYTQYFFILRVFEVLGIFLQKQKTNIYEKWLMQWSKTIIDMGGEAGSTLDLLRESLDTYIEIAEDKDESYLRKGEPIILNNSVAFRSNEFSVFLKKRYNIIYTNDELHSLLRDLNCKPQQVGKGRIRAWVYKPKELKEDTLFINEEHDAKQQTSN